MLHVVFGRAKTGKSEWVLHRIAELGDRSQQILIVPEHASHEAEVDLCRVCGNTVSRHAEVLSFRHLGDRVISRSGGVDQTTLDNGGKLLTLQDALMETLPVLKVYQRPSQKSSFLRQLLDLFDEFRCYEVTPEVLFEKAKSLGDATGEKLSDLSLIYAAYEAKLRSADIDVRDRMSKLCNILADSDYICGKDLFIDGFTYFNAQERTILSIFLRQARSVTITLLGQPDSREEIFAALQKTYGQLRRLAEQEHCMMDTVTLEHTPASSLDHAERYFFGENVAYEGDCTQIRLREADTVYTETEQVAADILRLVAQGACRWRDVTVAARNMAAYETVIETVFERYGIPVYLSRRSDILEKPVLSLLTGVLSAIENGYEYDDMFRWLKSGLAGLSADECDILENYVLKWDIHGAMWIRDVDWTEHPDGYGARESEVGEARLKKVNELRRRVFAMLSPLAEGLRGDGTGREKINALYDFMESLRLQEALEAQMRAQESSGRLQEAEETAQLWEILCGVLDQFVQILGEHPMRLDLFSRLFRQVLGEYSVGTIPASLDQVSVAEITRNDRHPVKYLFLMGANDHVLPDPGQSGGILNDDDRRALSEMNVELSPSGMDRMGMELAYLYTALSQPTAGLTISYPAGDISGAELRPSFVIRRFQELFPSLRVEKEGTVKGFRLTASIPALEVAGEHPYGALWQYFAENPRYTERVSLMDRAIHLTRGSLSPSAVRALYGDRISMSASRLERLRSCHFAYFMEYGLRAKPRTPAAFDAPQIGTFLHYLLENVTRDVLKRGGFAQVDDPAIHRLVQHYITQYMEQELPHFEQRTARFRHLFRRLKTSAYAVMDQVAEEMRHSDFVPLEFEFSFGDQGTLPAVVISEPDGELRLGGKVDRIDGWVKDDKLYLRVVDYKSGKKKFDLSAVKMGLDIQMLLYLFTLQKEGAAYFGREIEPAGVLYLPARDEILSAERNISPEKLLAKREAELQRSGLLLAEPEVLQAMEHESLSTPHYLPLRVSRDGSLSGSIASAAQLGKLGAYVDTLLHQISHEVRQGNIDADPWCRSEDDSYCKYCDWADACHFQDGRDGDHLNYILPVKAEEFWQQLEEGD